MKTNRAFTLIELMIVVAIMGIVAAVIIPLFVRYATRRSFDECYKAKIAQPLNEGRIGRECSADALTLFNDHHDMLTENQLRHWNTVFTHSSNSASAASQAPEPVQPEDNSPPPTPINDGFQTIVCGECEIALTDTGTGTKSIATCTQYDFNQSTNVMRLDRHCRNEAGEPYNTYIIQLSSYQKK